jgi:hypothetical protein
MYQKSPGVFMADWWDADGRRHRKQFSTSAAAREHEHRETALAHAERASREMKLAARTSSGKTSGAKKARTETVHGTIEPAKGKLGVMIPGMGAVATTFVAGVEAIRKGLAKPIGSLTQMGTVRLGKRTDGAFPEESRSSSRSPDSTIWSSPAGTSSKTTCTKPLRTPACSTSACSTS